MRILLQFFLGLLIALLVIGSITLWYFNRDLPDIDSLRNVQMQVPLRIYTADGKLLGEFGEKRRQPVPLSEIPLPLQEALIATEDQRFYEHPGVDFIGLTRAALKVLATHEKVEGGSTITMQVARNFFLDRQKTYSRKIREILLALKIGRDLPKDKVLELYLNQVYFGKRAYGVVAAAQVYYGKNIDQLTLAQMAMLAGLPQAPSALNPITNPAAALDRRNHVLGRMLDQHYITEAQYQEAIAEPIDAHYHGLKIQAKAPYVAEMVRDEMVKQYGDAAYTMGLNVYTTVNSGLQAQASNAVEAGLISYDQRHGYRGPEAHWNISSVDSSTLIKQLKQLGSVNDLEPAVVISVAGQQATLLLSNATQVTLPWSGIQWARRQYENGKSVGAAPAQASDVLSVGDVIRVHQVNGQWMLTELPNAEASVISINPQNGAIIALVGGFNFHQSKFNRVISAQRQPGSSFKPFLYSAALEKGDTLATVINDAPIAIPDQDSSGLWRPQNDNLKFGGPTRLRVALMNSRNLVSIRLLQEITVPYAVDYMRRFGFDDAALPQSLSLALGTGQVTPIELARGMAVFANGGYLIQPYFIQKVTDANDNVLFEANPAVVVNGNPDQQNVAPQIISPSNAYLINSAMKSVIKSGTGKEAFRILKRNDLAGKTGTTQDQNDNWFIGFNTQVLTVSWLGFDQPRSTYEYGAQAALPIWTVFMQAALAGMPEMELPRPSDIVSVRINTKTGLATTPSDPSSIFEQFTIQTAPRLSASSINANSSADDEADDDEGTSAEVNRDNEPLF